MEIAFFQQSMIKRRESSIAANSIDHFSAINDLNHCLSMNYVLYGVFEFRSHREIFCYRVNFLLQSRRPG